MTTNTAESFRSKWTKNQELVFEETLRVGSDIHTWILNRNGFADEAALRAFLANKHRILDGGCGNGRVTALLQRCAPPTAEVVGIDLVAAPVAAANLAKLPNVQVREKDLLGPLEDLGRFDFIYCQEVLHHTADPEGAFRNLCGRLAPGGEIAIYVYKRKAPVREFVDDFVRDRIGKLDYDAAMVTARQITALGQALASAGVSVRVPAVDVLEIPEGEYDIQRFVYHFFMKCFWSDALSFEENAVINYDWYHPQLCTRHTLDEIRGWFGAAGLAVVQEHVDFYGITMRGRVG